MVALFAGVVVVDGGHAGPLLGETPFKLEFVMLTQKCKFSVFLDLLYMYLFVFNLT